MSFFIGLIVGIALSVAAYVFRSKIGTLLGVKFPPKPPEV